MGTLDLAKHQPTSLKIIRWTARVWAAMILLGLMMFFLEHLGWFTRPGVRPPGRVWWVMALHLTLMIGLAVGWRWELPGAAIVLLSAPLFYYMTAGENGMAYSVLTMIPATLWLACGVLTKRGMTTRPPF